MTYTFKLSRRLAVSRTFGLLPAVLIFAACSGGDATAPDSSPIHPWNSGSQDDPRFRQTAPVTVGITPSNVTVETNQLIRFQAQGKNSAGDSVATFVEWSATGGTILPDGRFSAAATGTFMVFAIAPKSEEEHIDTAVVQVVRRQVKLSALDIAPGSTTLAPGMSQTFLATGYLKNGRPSRRGQLVRHRRHDRRRRKLCCRRYRRDVPCHRHQRYAVPFGHSARDHHRTPVSAAGRCT